MAMTQNRILILDFGSQFTQLIARRIRELHVYCEVHPPTVSSEWVREWNPRGIILSGGPASVYETNAPLTTEDVVHSGAPVLGICYGMQIIAQMHGAPVVPGKREYGRADVTITGDDDLFHGFPAGSAMT